MWCFLAKTCSPGLLSSVTDWYGKIICLKGAREHPHYHPFSAALSLVLPIHISVLWYLSVLVSSGVDFHIVIFSEPVRDNISLKATASYTLLGLHAATVWKKLLALLSLRQLYAWVSSLHSQTELCAWDEHIKDHHTANNGYNSLKPERLAHRDCPHIKGLIPAMLW